jgi:predicted Rossmann fold nucleotide-binding protein DprA/Smf involved in DNA uptake
MFRQPEHYPVPIDGTTPKRLKMKLAVIGSRTFTNKVLLEKTLARVKTPISLLISGGAIGADTLAKEWAEENGIPTKIYKPDYDKYGKRAPLERNTIIVEAADCVLVFHDGKSNGTLDALRKAERLGRQTYKVMFSPEPIASRLK